MGFTAGIGDGLGRFAAGSRGWLLQEGKTICEICSADFQLKFVAATDCSVRSQTPYSNQTPADLRDYIDETRISQSSVECESTTALSHSDFSD